MLEGLVTGVRTLVADDLDIGVRAKATTGHASSSPDAPEITADHPRVQEIVRLAQVYGGVLLSGPPGTSKSFFAAAAGQIMAGGDTRRYQFVQFHASYQYEDFMSGFAPTETGFRRKEGPFLRLVKAAAADRDSTYVLVVDELSRADVGRVFGEALTYIERSKRELSFTIANSEKIVIPSNFVVLATMNPFDRGVDEVDAAFERRFAKISMEPDRELLDEILTINEMPEALRRRVVTWFERMNGLAKSNPAAAVGHAYFSDASDEGSLRDIWDYQLQYLVQRAFRRDQPSREAMEASWEHVFSSPDPVAEARPEGTPPEPEV
ncbi:McrB family protein [Ornithinimicrobium sp. LYQ92]|uniref:McrB family protein n=1 Tax=Serinicoccus sp. LYQ92 TaxID=3378798 RepID=UPI0038518620